MKITVEHCTSEENEIILRCPSLDEEMLHVLALLKSYTQKLCVWQENKDLIFLPPDDVLYGESVDEKTFLYTDEDVLRCSLSLAELAARYEAVGFFRISKSAVVNLHRIKSLQSCSGSRIEATMQNGERVLISRHYAPLLRERLGL